MGASNALESALLNLIFATRRRRTSATLRAAAQLDGWQLVDCAAHWDPGEGGAQNTTEATYTGYGRVAVTRDDAWTVGGTAPCKAENAEPITFGACTDGSSTVTHFSIGSDETGAGHLFISGALTAPLEISAGITPSFAAGAPGGNAGLIPWASPSTQGRLSERRALSSLLWTRSWWQGRVGPRLIQEPTKQFIGCRRGRSNICG